MSNQIKQYINNFSIRTKSSERVRNQKSNSPNSRPLSKQIQKNQQQHQNLIYNQNILVHQPNHQKGQIQIEGELNFNNKNPKKNTQKQGKNVGHNAFELMSNGTSNFKITRTGNFHMQKKKNL